MQGVPYESTRKQTMFTLAVPSISAFVLCSVEQFIRSQVLAMVLKWLQVGASAREIR